MKVRVCDFSSSSINQCFFQIVLQWDEKEVKSALQDKNLLAAVLMDKGVAA